MLNLHSLGKLMRLARRQAGRIVRIRRFQPARRTFFLTAEGLAFVVFMASIGFAAINTGANLLYLFFSMMAALMLFSAAASWSNQKGLRIHRAAPAETMAGVSIPIRLRVENRKRFFHSYSLRLIDADESGESRGAGFLLRLKPGNRTTIEYETAFECRGVKRLKHVAVHSRFPFGFSEKGVSVPLLHEILVYPRLYPAMEYLWRHGVDLGEWETPKKGQGASLHALRDYGPDDSARLIHWKLSAKRDALIVKELETDEQRRICLILDNLAPDGRARQLKEAFEAAVSCAASVARDLIDAGCGMALLSRVGRVPFDRGPAQLRRILRTLAVVELREADQGAAPALPRPEENASVLWFDFGAPIPALARTSRRFNIVDTSGWPPAASAPAKEHAA